MICQAWGRRTSLQAASREERERREVKPVKPGRESESRSLCALWQAGRSKHVPVAAHAHPRVFQTPHLRTPFVDSSHAPHRAIYYGWAERCVYLLATKYMFYALHLFRLVVHQQRWPRSSLCVLTP